MKFTCLQANIYSVSLQHIFYLSMIYHKCPFPCFILANIYSVSLQHIFYLSMIYHKCPFPCFILSHTCKRRMAWGSFFLHPYVSLSAPPQCNAKTKIFLLFFKNPKIHIRPTLLFLLPNNAIR